MQRVRISCHTILFVVYFAFGAVGRPSVQLTPVDAATHSYVEAQHPVKLGQIITNGADTDVEGGEGVQRSIVCFIKCDNLEGERKAEEEKEDGRSGAGEWKWTDNVDDDHEVVCDEKDGGIGGESKKHEEQDEVEKGFNFSPPTFELPWTEESGREKVDVTGGQGKKDEEKEEKEDDWKNGLLGTSKPAHEEMSTDGCVSGSVEGNGEQTEKADVGKKGRSTESSPIFAPMSTDEYEDQFVAKSDDYEYQRDDSDVHGGGDDAVVDGSNHGCKRGEDGVCISCDISSTKFGQITIDILSHHP